MQMLTEPVPVKEYGWGSSLRHRELTCRNHRGMKYLTKNPWLRTLHIVEVDPEVLATGKIECDCAFSDLLVVGEEERDQSVR